MKNNNTLKLIITIAVILVILVIYFIITISQDINKLPENCYKIEAYYDPYNKQDSVDYVKYFYNEKGDKELKQEKYKIENIDEVKSYIENFKEWMETDGRSQEFGLDTDDINQNDYALIETKNENRKYDNYTVYYFDTKNNILHYMHVKV